MKEHNTSTMSDTDERHTMATKRNILIVDDEHTMRDFLESSLTGRYNVFTADNAISAMAVLKSEKIDLLLSDVQMPVRGGLELLDDIKEQLDYHPTTIMMTAFGTIDGAVEATKNGACDYLTKPFGLDQLNHVILRAFEYKILRQENVTLRNNLTVKTSNHGLLGNHSSMVQLRDKIKMIADSRGTVLLQGESGTGKEVVARSIHFSSSRANGAFIRLNCAAIPESLLESELFGYERGAFTGAVQACKGKFELADGGTLLLDEISEMPYAMQAKLLRVLQEREFTRLGAKFAIKSDVRIIATSNRNLKEEIKEKRFREDLYFRLNVIPIHVPHLRVRKDDIPLLANHFCQNFCVENNKAVMTFSDSVMRQLTSMDWPGNVRQLQNVIERAVILSSGTKMEIEHMGLAEEIDDTDKPSGFNSEMTLKDMEKELILQKLHVTRGNRTLAAQELGISVRTLRNKLNLYTDMGVEIPN